MIRLDLITLAICSSYVTLGIAAPGTAKSLWAAYAVVTFVLAAIAIVLEPAPVKRGRSAPSGG